MNVIDQTIDQALIHHKAGDFGRASHLYNAVLNLKPFDEGVLYLLSDLYLRQEYSGLAINLLTNLLDRHPKNGAAWCNLGIAFRKEDRYDQAVNAWERALKIQGDTAEVCCNMATLYSDRAQPDKAIHWLDRSLKCDPESVGARWSKSLALLTKKDWANGWPLYEFRQQLEGWHSRTTVDAPMWDFTPTDHLYIHGEQGVGDEIMFLSCLDEVLPLAKRVTLELNERVAGIARKTWPSVSIVTTETPGDYSAKIAIGSLAARLRRSADAFPGTPYLKPDPELVEHYKARLTAIGPRPWVALAWHGGTKQTRVKDRSIDLDSFEPIRNRYTCVSAQYEHTNPMLQKAREDAGLVRLDNLCVGEDLAAQAALFAAVDYVVTVQQTAVHVAGAVGAKTYALIGPTPHWRYGLTGDMPWYRSVQLCRAKNGWAEQINLVEKAIADHAAVPSAERRAA
jgi:tetratricopeptide (TPR) repeat protein